MAIQELLRHLPAPTAISSMAAATPCSRAACTCTCMGLGMGIHPASACCADWAAADCIQSVCHREAEERRQAIALEKQKAIDQRDRELAAQRAQREAERQALQRLQKSFAVRVEGSACISKAEKV